MDVNVPGLVTSQLRQRKIDVLTAQEDAANQMEDEALLARARQLDRILFTLDADFLAITQRWLSTGREFNGVLFGTRQLAINAYIADLELISRLTLPSEWVNKVGYLPL